MPVQGDWSVQLKMGGADYPLGSGRICGCRSRRRPRARISSSLLSSAAPSHTVSCRAWLRRTGWDHRYLETQKLGTRTTQAIGKHVTLQEGQYVANEMGVRNSCNASEDGTSRTSKSHSAPSCRSTRPASTQQPSDTSRRRIACSLSYSDSPRRRLHK